MFLIVVIFGVRLGKFRQNYNSQSFLYVKYTYIVYQTVELDADNHKSN